jgi:hypothetical protein
MTLSPIQRIVLDALMAPDRGCMWADLADIYSRVGGGCLLDGDSGFEHWIPILLDILYVLAQEGLVERRGPSRVGSTWRTRRAASDWKYGDPCDCQARGLPGANCPREIPPFSRGS